MKKMIVLILFLFFSYTVEAVEFGTSIPTNSEYAPGRNYGFQIKCDDIPNVSNVIFEWNLVNNYTANKISNTFYYNLTDLGAGNYPYKWYVNNTTDVLVFFDTYNILQNSSTTISLTLDGTEKNKSYKLYDTANFFADFIPNKQIRLESTYPNWTTITNTSLIHKTINLTASGLFSLIAIFDGDENYTSKSKTLYFDTGPPQFLGASSVPNSPVGYIPGVEYKFQVNVKDATLADVWFESNHTGTMKTYDLNSDPPVQNSSGIFWITIKGLGAGKFSYRWHAKDDLNDESSTNFFDYEILKMNPLVMEILPSTNIKEGTQITANCYSINPLEISTSDFNFYKDSEPIENISTSTRMDTFLLSAGTYNFTCNTTGNVNYTNQSITKTIVVSSAPPQEENFTGELKIVNVIFPEIKTGESGEGSFDLFNEMTKNIFNLTVNLVGISKSWYTTSEIPYIYSNETKNVKINFSIPSDAEGKNYPITIRIIGNTSEGKIVSAEKNSEIKIIPLIKNRPPSLFMSYANTTEEEAVFSLEWSDDNGLSGYIFSSNISGVWENDSWVPLSGSSGLINVTKTLSSVNKVIAWKVYANDTNNEWSVSDEYIAEVKRAEFNMLNSGFFVVILVLIVMIILIFIIVFIKKRKTEEIEYVYSKDELNEKKT